MIDIGNMEFFQELVRLGEDAVAPYSLSVVDVPTGNVWFMARVHYQGGIVDSLQLSASVMGAYNYWA